MTNEQEAICRTIDQRARDQMTVRLAELRAEDQLVRPVMWTGTMTLLSNCTIPGTLEGVTVEAAADSVSDAWAEDIRRARASTVWCKTCGLDIRDLPPISRWMRDGEPLCLHWFGVPAASVPK